MNRWLLALGVVSVAFVSCQQTPVQPGRGNEPSSDGYRLRGTIEVQFGDGELATATFTPNRLRTQGGFVPDADIELTRTSFSAVNTASPPANFLNAKFALRNKSGSAIDNMTLIAYHSSVNAADTALKNVQNFGGLSQPDLDTYTRAITPCHGTTLGGGLSAGNEDLLLLAEHELAALTTSAGAALGVAEYLFPFGYVARDINVTTSRTVAANASSDTGTVTFCVRTPNSNQPLANAYRFSMTFYVFDNPTETTRVSESLEEQISSGAEARKTALNPDAVEISALRNSPLHTLDDGNKVNVCQVRTVGSAASPLARLETGILNVASGSKDACFGAQGLRTTPISTTEANEGTAMTIDSQRRIVVAGYTQVSTAISFAVVRYNPDGSLDQSFGTGGVATADFGAGTEAPRAVVTDASNRVIVVGSAGADIAVVRFNENGALDNTFSDDGLLKINFSLGNTDYGRAVALDASGNIYVAGYTVDALSNADFAIAKLTTAGLPDPSFDLDGRQTVAFALGSNTEIASAIKIDSAGKIVVAGVTGNGANANDFAVAKLSATGQLDSTFDMDGKQTVNFTNTDDTANALAIDAANNLYLAGYKKNGGNTIMAVAKLTSAGVLDTSFDTDGLQTVGFGAGNTEIAYGVFLDSSNSVVLTGTVGPLFNGDFGVARLTSSGATDTTFSADGKETYDFALGGDEGTGGAIDANGKIVIAGSSSAESFSVARINP
jgi:uncharacterized delta-60 repeat protein